MDEERKHQIWLENATSISRNKALRGAFHKPKNLASTGHPSLITEVDPNPKVISNAPKKRFSKTQRHYLMKAYVHYAVYGEVLSEEAFYSFQMEEFGDQPDTVAERKAAKRSAKRSAKNLAEYGYVVLSYEVIDHDTDDMTWCPNTEQPILKATATMAAIEKGKEFMEQDGYPTDPETLRQAAKEEMAAWGYCYKGL
jgi:hypothetical protein